MALEKQTGAATETPLKTARQLLSDRRPLDALEIVDALLEEHPEQPLALVFRARILEWLGEFADARAILKRAKKAGADPKSVSDALSSIVSVEKRVKQAIAYLDKDNVAKADELLIAEKKGRYNLMVELLLARARFAAGKLAGAEQLVGNVLAAAPEHNEGLEMKFLIKKAKAEKKAVPGKLGEIKVDRNAREEAQEFLAELPDRVKALEEAMDGGRERPDKHIKWLRKNADHLHVVNWSKDVDQAKAAHFAFAKSPAHAKKNYVSDLVTKSVEFDYITWPRKIQDYIRGKSVLDVGCGFGAFGNGFLVAGAKAYTGIDPQMPLDSSRVKNKRKREWSDLGMTPNEIMQECPDIHLINGIIEDLETKATFDAVVLHNVTEHLHNIREIIPRIRTLLNPGGYLIYQHHNFYCWNGHHRAPNQPRQYEKGSPKHDEVADWNHILIAPDLPEDHFFNTNLNQIRLDEMKSLTYDNYNVEKWLEIESPPAVADRLTDDILSRLHDFDESLTRRDLMVNVALCVAQTK